MRARPGRGGVVHSVPVPGGGGCIAKCVGACCRVQTEDGVAARRTGSTPNKFEGCGGGGVHLCDACLRQSHSASGLVR